MECVQLSRAVNSCLVRRLLPITRLPFPPPSSVSRRLRSLEVGARLRAGRAGEGGACCREWAGSSAPLRPPGSKEATTTLHMLTLLKDLLPCFPEGLVKSCSETLLRVMTLSHVVSSGPSQQAGHTESAGGIAADPRPWCWFLGNSLVRPRAGPECLPALTLLLASTKNAISPHVREAGWAVFRVLVQLAAGLRDQGGVRVAPWWGWSSGSPPASSSALASLLFLRYLSAILAQFCLLHVFSCSVCSYTHFKLFILKKA